MADMVIVKAKVKELVSGYNVASDLPDALNEAATKSIKDAVARADSNGRKTVMGKDVPGSFVSTSDAPGLIVKAKIKDVAGNVNVAGDFADALGRSMGCLVKAAAERADANGRKTVMGKDL